MTSANAATVSPSFDTADGRTHLTVANLRTMAHRSHEWPATLAQLRLSGARDTLQTRLAQAQAAEQGCDQVVWLDAVERRWVEEMGGMNLFFVFGEGDSARVLTPAT